MKPKFELMRKFLIVKIGAIGDVIMMYPIILEIKKENPNNHITWICGSQVINLLQTIGGIDELVSVNEKKLFSNNILSKILQLMHIWFKIIFKHYDTVIIGHADYRYKLVALPVCAKERVSLNHNKGRKNPIHGRYFGDEYVRLFSAIDDYRMYRVAPPKIKIELKADLLNLLEIKTNQKIISIAPGGAKNILSDDGVRRWPIRYYANIASRLLQDGHKVIITGASSDQWVNEYFNKLNVINLVGKTNVIELIGVFNISNLLLTHDSGPLHIGTLAGVNIIALFGPTHPETRIPRGNKTRSIWNVEDLACSPCYDGKTYANCTDNLCLKGITVNRVYAEMNLFLETLHL
jgi:heptosyltransferase II